MNISIETKFNIGDTVLNDNRKRRVQSISIMVYKRNEEVETSNYYELSGKMGKVAEEALEAIHE